MSTPQLIAIGSILVGLAAFFFSNSLLRIHRKRLQERIKTKKEIIALHEKIKAEKDLEGLKNESSTTIDPLKGATTQKQFLESISLLEPKAASTSMEELYDLVIQIREVEKVLSEINGPGEKYAQTMAKLTALKQEFVNELNKPQIVTQRTNPEIVKRQRPSSEE